MIFKTLNNLSSTTKLATEKVIKSTIGKRSRFEGLRKTLKACFEDLEDKEVLARPSSSQTK